jgi:exopolyphosphatase/guanosine-5'-triphosphate,3'-diphosphate pyrophosphatase
MAPPRRLALIDMGTNTFHLLIAALEPGQPPHIRLRTRTAVKLGEGGISDGRITETAQARAIKALRAFREEIDLHGVREQDIRAVATSAVRVARNGPAFLADVFAQTGIRVEVIPGEQEAELIWAGVREAVPLGNSEPSLLMDIGGGSVEFIIANQGNVFWKQSFEIGAQRLLDQFFWHDPITPTEIAAEEAYLAGILSPLTAAVGRLHPTALVGASGSFDTFCDLEAARCGQARDMHNPPPESELPLDAFYHHFAQLKTLAHPARVALPGMTAMRADMIVVAGVLIDWVLRTYGLTRIRVSAWALKEGLLARAATTR